MQVYNFCIGKTEFCLQVKQLNLKTSCNRCLFFSISPPHLKTKLACCLWSRGFQCPSQGGLLKHFLFQMVSLWTIASASVEQDAVATLSTQDPRGFLVLNRQEPN